MCCSFLMVTADYYEDSSEDSSEDSPKNIPMIPRKNLRNNFGLSLISYGTGRFFGRISIYSSILMVTADFPKILPAILPNILTDITANILMQSEPMILLSRLISPTQHAVRTYYSFV